MLHLNPDFKDDRGKQKATPILTEKNWPEEEHSEPTVTIFHNSSLKLTKQPSQILDFGAGIRLLFVSRFYPKIFSKLRETITRHLLQPKSNDFTVKNLDEFLKF